MSIRIIHVDDDRDFAELTSSWLEREFDPEPFEIEIEIATGAEEGIEKIDSEADCIVSDFDMPSANGLEFLDRVREEYPDLPFILFTGKGSEEIASEAIRRGVTDYIQKQPGVEVYTILANRIENAVEAYRAEKAAEETRQRYEKLIEHASDIVFVVDPNGVFGYLSPAVKRLLGYKPEELLSESGFEYIHPDDREAAAEEFMRVVEDPQYTAATEFRVEHKDGSWVNLEIRGRNQLGDSHLDGIVVIGRDISERKERKQELERLETLLQRSTDALFVSDIEDANLYYVNDTACDLLGYSQGELLEKTFYDIQTAFPEADSWDRHIERLRSEENVVYEGKLVREDGSEVPVEINAGLESIGETQYIISAARDITHRKEYEQKLQRQIEYLDEFATVVSHDLRSPLSVAAGRVELAREKYGDDEELEAAANALDRSQALIDDLLELARENEQMGEIQSIDLAEIAESCWRSIQTEEATLIVDVERAVRADPSRLKQLFENLFRNSIEHGVTARATRGEDERDDVTITVGDLPDRSGFYVADDGGGISEREREDVFRSGYSTKSDGPGFGLSIVRKIVHAHGWEISIEESDDGGARFEITGVESGTGA